MNPTQPFSGSPASLRLDLSLSIEIRVNLVDPKQKAPASAQLAQELAKILWHYQEESNYALAPNLVGLECN